jgi:ABC-type uncharacterized transport system permease subunit
LHGRIPRCCRSAQIITQPAKLLAQRLASPWEWAALLLMAAACFVASELFWRFSLRHYTSASA